MKSADSNNMLSLLAGFALTGADDVARRIADDFRRRRIEKNLTRRQVAERARVALPTLTRFEQKGLISLESLIKLAMALGYVSELESVFSEPKFSTMAELEQIRKNMNKKKATGKMQ